jgi:hypothetical protein
MREGLALLVESQLARPERLLALVQVLPPELEQQHLAIELEVSLAQEAHVLEAARELGRLGARVEAQAVRL